MRYQRDFEWSPRRHAAGFRYGRDYGARPDYGPPGRGGYGNAFAGQPGRRYGGDFWWMGERAMPPRRFAGGYDDAYRRFSATTHPRHSPVGGMQPGAGGAYGARQSRIHARENARFGDWTRWF